MRRSKGFAGVVVRDLSCPLTLLLALGCRAPSVDASPAAKSPPTAAAPSTVASPSALSAPVAPSASTQRGRAEVFFLPAAAAQIAAAANTVHYRKLDVAERLPVSVGAKPRARSIVLGEGWGCAWVESLVPSFRLSSDGALAGGDFRTVSDWRWQCWDAHLAHSGGTVVAFPVIWLKGKSALEAGAHRLCAQAEEGGTRKCWHPPVPGRTRGVVFPMPDSVAADGEFKLAPNTVCSTRAGAGKCWGRTPLPAPAGIVEAVLSPGQDASACALHEGSVVCWGGVYSAAGTPSTPVTIEFEPAAPDAEVAVVRRDLAPTDESCMVRTGCFSTAATLPRCRPGRVQEWYALLAEAKLHEGQQVRIYGVGELNSSAGMRCPCCAQEYASAILGTKAQFFELSGWFCTGDPSQLCCTAPAYGQIVVAAGKLTSSQGQWSLADATLCSP